MHLEITSATENIKKKYHEYKKTNKHKPITSKIAKVNEVINNSRNKSIKLTTLNCLEEDVNLNYVNFYMAKFMFTELK